MDIERLKKATGIRKGLAHDIGVIPQIARGQVWCKSCGSTRRINGVNATLGGGWPKCCGYTMTIDSPAEHSALQGKDKP